MARLRTLMGKLTDVLFGNSRANERRKRAARALRCEPLETRNLLAFSASVAVDVGSGPSTAVTVDEDDANLTATYSITIDDLPAFADQQGWMTLYLEYDFNEDLGDENGDVQWMDGGCYGYLSFDFETPVSPSLDLTEEIRVRVIDDGLKEDAPEWHELELNADSACYHWCGYSSGTCEMGVIPLGDAAARITIVDNDEWEVKIESAGTELDESLGETETQVFTITRENETDVEFPLPVTVTLSGDAEWQTDYIFSTPHCNAWGCDGDFNDEDLRLDYSDFSSLADDEVVFIIPAGTTSLSVEAKAVDETVVEILREQLTATLSSNWLKVYYQIEDSELGGGCCQAVPCGGYDINTGVNGSGDPLNEATVTIKDDNEITLEWSEFKDHLNMVPDPGTGLDYTGHHWEDRDGDGTVADWERLPVAYESGTLIVMDAQFTGELDPDLAGTVKIMGYAYPDPGNPCLAVPTREIDATIESGAVKFNGESIDILTEDDMALYHDSFRIFWKFAMPGDVDASGDLIWRDAGEQVNTLYATYKGALTGQYHTVIHIGSQMASGIKLDPANSALDTEAEVEAAIVDAIWGEFSDLQVKTVAVPKADGTTAGDMTLWYYKNWRNFNKRTTQHLLEPIVSGSTKHGDGSCDAWTDFFRDILVAQGINDTTAKTIKANNVNYGTTAVPAHLQFIIKEWEYYPFNKQEAPNGPIVADSLPQILEDHVVGVNMVDFANHNYIKTDHYDWVSDAQAGAKPKTLAAGQGPNSNPASLFDAHVVVERTSVDQETGQVIVTWYDPSYGQKYEKIAATYAAAQSAVLNDFVSASIEGVVFKAAAKFREAWVLNATTGQLGVHLNADNDFADDVWQDVYFFMKQNPNLPPFIVNQFKVQ